MPKAYYSSTLPQTVTDVWAMVRDFNNYPRYIDGVDVSVVEDAKAGDAVGAIRRFRYEGAWIRQRLLALSDVDRVLTYAGLDPFPFPPQADDRPQPAPVEYQASIQLTPVVDGDRTLVEWWLTFECPPMDTERWTSVLVEAIAHWVESLAAHVTSPRTEGPERAYFSKAFPQSAETVWAAVRDFGEYRWGEGVGETHIEGDLDANTPGAIRAFEYYGQLSRQRLTAYSVAERSMTWESAEPFDATLTYHRAGIRITPVVASNGAFVEWWSEFFARQDSVARWREHQVAEFGKSLGRLERLLG